MISKSIFQKHMNDTADDKGMDMITSTKQTVASLLIKIHKDSEDVSV